ncbi:BRCA2-interacting transcriptional repressor EMSY-like [Dendronephthya gigantea]|uniref:BRCA2-interacting transcriptional repressor EMSY-like n=1 Tax=Dendronephthya gigantea TaxID=151771 RepID=UPI00106A60A3|nr:BRCA2-interacting transcriptional repressor EMSY-like [Dendronephthya gigantea]XP_028412809.1 BRCA2-interacting transcriptional repressor EMSY-like [Dendronephthya gigantea]XP_028412810.1 BRCA2-interacting transcriptional repressor EMSY-like [Dendronephthya gigantea]
MELTRDESKRILRRIELEAYSALVTALRAQGELDRQKKKLLRELGEQLSISTERHRAEIRRAISDDRLSMIAECVCGSDASVEWESEGRRVVPLMPRLVPQTAFTSSATAAANHAASVNSTIPSTTKVRLKDDDEDFRSRKRQRANSPGTVQKVIVTSVTKTSTSPTTVRKNTTISKTPTLPGKQENNQLSGMKMTSSATSVSKSMILGTKSSVSVAPSKYVAPLPASCLQAHASVVSGNKNRMNLNVVKTKPAKPKIKTLPASVKIKSVSTGINVAPSVVQTVAQSLLSIAKTKGPETGGSTNKIGHVSKSPSTITVAPRSSISLTAFKTTMQPKQNPQSTTATIRNAEGISRQSSAQLGKAVSVSRRPLPAILPKTISPKTLTTVSSPGRKLASILPAPTKSTSSTLPNPRIIPVVGSSGSSPIPIAPSPRPPQARPASLTNSAGNKVTTVSIAPGQTADFKKDTQNNMSSDVHAQSPSGSQNSSPISSKSLDNIHERETLSPVNEIITLVTSPSNVPFVPSSPVKSRSNPSLTTSEISLECNENLLEDLVKDDEIAIKKRSANLSSSTQQVHETNESQKDVVTDSLQQTLKDAQPCAEGDFSPVEGRNEATPATITSTSKPIDLSPLVSELISSSSFDFDKKQFDDVSDLVQSNDNGDLFDGEFPVLDLATELSNVSETVKSDAKNIGSMDTMEEDKNIKQFSPVEKHASVATKPLEEFSAGDRPGGSVASIEEKQQEYNKKKDSRDAVVSCHVNKDVNATEHLQDKLASPRNNKVGDEEEGEPTASDENVCLKEKVEDHIAETMKTFEAMDKQKLIKDSEQAITSLSEFLKDDKKLGNISVSSTADTMSENSQIIIHSNVTENKPKVVNTTSLEASGGKGQQDVFWDRVQSGGKHSTEQTEAEVKEEKEDIAPDRDNKESSVNKAAVVVEKCSQTNETQVTQEKLNEGRQENTEEPSSGSEVGSPEGNLVRTSNRKRKAPPPRDLSVHPPGWVRSALQLLQKVSRFRGSARSKNARSAASWFLKPVATSEAPGYYKVIKSPMDFGTIKTKLEAGEYIAPCDFHRDMLLVKANCCKYNPPGHVVRKDCDEVFQFYEAEYERFVEKLDKIYLPTPKKQKPSPS